MTVSRVKYRDIVVGGFKTRVFEVNGLLVGVALDIGPRVLYLAREDKEEFNIFNVLPDFSVETPEGKWMIYGGHRLWTSPEAMPRSYSLDDKPVDVRVEGNSIVVTGNPEYANNVLKKIRIEPGEKKYTVKVTHEIVNIGRWPIEFACWALSVVRREGFAVIPVKPKPVDPRGLLPDRYLVIWPYTALNDPRLQFTQNYVVIRQDPSIEKPVKVGARANPPLIAYWVNDFVFVKYFEEVHAPYPDYGSTVEVYTNNKFLEVETLGPLRKVEPGESNVHVEVWEIKRIGSFKLDERVFEEKIIGSK